MYLTVGEFRELCDEISFSKFVFSSRDQTDVGLLSGFLVLECVYKDVKIARCPDAVCFMGDHSVLQCESVKRISYCVKGGIYFITIEFGSSLERRSVRLLGFV